MNTIWYPPYPSTPYQNSTLSNFLLPFLHTKTYSSFFYSILIFCHEVKLQDRHTFTLERCSQFPVGNVRRRLVHVKFRCIGEIYSTRWWNKKFNKALYASSLFIFDYFYILTFLMTSGMSSGDVWSVTIETKRWNNVDDVILRTDLLRWHFGLTGRKWKIKPTAILFWIYFSSTSKQKYVARKRKKDGETCEMMDDIFVPRRWPLKTSSY